MNSKKTKHSKPRYLLHLIWAIPLIGIIWSAVTTYYNTTLNKATSAKPQADELSHHIQQSGGSVLHTYNRSASGKVRSPTYELYIDYPDTSIENRAKKITTELTQLGYRTKYIKYAYENECSKYGFMSSSHLPDGELATEQSARRYCMDLTGVDDPLLFGSTENNKQPYYTVYGERGEDNVFVQVSDETFKITSNDFWRDEYSKKYSVANETVRSGHSMTVVVFGRVEKQKD